jgi:hypothetical protein
VLFYEPPKHHGYGGAAGVPAAAVQAEAD